MSWRQAIPTPLWHLCLLTLPRLVATFGTVNEPNLLGQHNEHEMVTRLAFQCPQGQKSDGVCFEPGSLDQLAGYHMDVYGIPIIGGGFNGAVGAPDTMDPVPEGAEAHCDDADFIDIPGYPRTRDEATAALQTCVDHLRGRFRQAWGSARRLLDEDGRIRKDMVSLSNMFGGDCIYAFPSLQVNLQGRAKCDVIEGLGRALHGVQDFYAHSNWVDKHDPSQPISDINPPGLARTDRAPFIENLGATGPIPADQIPHNLSTGCFVLPDRTPGEGDCANRATHHTLTKDHGVIYLDGSFGTVGPDTPRAELVPENFGLAVRAAVEASRVVWENFRAELRKQYGQSQGDLLICSLVRDDPIRDCRHRAVSFVLDRSQMSRMHRTSHFERLTAQALASMMAADGTDKFQVIQFDRDAELVSSWEKPIAATIGEIGTTERLPSISKGLALAIDEILQAYPDTHINRGAAVLLSAGIESHEWSGGILRQIWRAESEGIRVHFGCINMPSTEKDQQHWLECFPGEGVVAAVLSTGGAFAFIDQEHESPSEFANHVFSRGLTVTDNTDEEETTYLWPHIEMAEMLTQEDTTKYFSINASAGQSLVFTFRDLTRDGLGSTRCFTVSLQDKVTETKLSNVIGCPGRASTHLVHHATRDIELLLVAQYDVASDVENVENMEEPEIVFTVRVQIGHFELNGTETASLSPVAEALRVAASTSVAVGPGQTSTPITEAEAPSVPTTDAVLDISGDSTVGLISGQVHEAATLQQEAPVPSVPPTNDGEAVPITDDEAAVTLIEMKDEL
ncbi:Opticin [Echria macrotheca]|uniref:Opticin n=1 Tax=Echria macrotheca TaxID=438768 RepID=A0AAJ0BKS6_9PEZI|nr:Opticin [Echria macrotheca]